MYVIQVYRKENTMVFLEEEMRETAHRHLVEMGPGGRVYKVENMLGHLRNMCGRIWKQQEQCDPGRLTWFL